MSKSKVLKLIADWRFGAKPNGTREYSDIKPEERDNNSWWYLHGDLQSFVGFDKATVTDCFSDGFSKETINWAEIEDNTVIKVFSDNPRYEMYFTGEIDVEIEGINKPCKGYFYVTNERKVSYKDALYSIWEQRGLVCFAEDTRACEYAKRKMNEKSRIL